MTSRRRFLTGVLAAGLMPVPGWAAAGAPVWLSAAKTRDGAYALVGLDAAGAAVFQLPMPGRGHAAAAHPARAEAVAFARRPGNFALVVDCTNGEIAAEMTAPEGRHFYGHGVFSADGSRLYTPENDYDAARGVIGVWDADHGYARIGEFESGGVGPHDMVRLPGSDVYAVANGGIETHPDSGRAKLNLFDMAPNLTYVTGEGRLLEAVSLREAWHLNSIRHLSVRDDGRVGFAMQWQGDSAEAPALLGLHEMGGALVLCDAPDYAQMQGYAGSVAFSGDGARVAISSPRGGLVQVFDGQTGAHVETIAEPDVCGLNSAGDGFVASSGAGRVFGIGARLAATHDLAFDNHLVRVGA